MWIYVNLYIESIMKLAFWTSTTPNNNPCRCSYDFHIKSIKSIYRWYFLSQLPFIGEIPLPCLITRYHIYFFPLDSISHHSEPQWQHQHVAESYPNPVIYFDLPSSRLIITGTLINRYIITGTLIIDTYRLPIMTFMAILVYQKPMPCHQPMPSAGHVFLHPFAHHLPVASHEALASRCGRGENSLGVVG